MAFTAMNRRIMGSVGLALVGLTLSGCGSKAEQPRRDEHGSASPPGIPKLGSSGEPPPTAALDFTGLRGVLSGKWELKKEYTENHTLEFTSGKTVFLKRYGFEKVAKYDFTEGVLTITAESDGMRRAGATLKPTSKGHSPNEYVYAVEFLSDGEISLRLDRSGEGFDWFQLAGRWKRVSLPDNREQFRTTSGPVADAKRQVQKIEQKLVKLEAIHKAALADRDELAAKLRSVGVNSPADLKNNVRGMLLAENVVKLATEIEGLERQLAVIDTELLKAKSIVRRMEREQAALSDDEMRNLAVQLREAEERTDGTPLPVTPFDVEAAVEKALKGSTKPNSPKKSK